MNITTRESAVDPVLDPLERHELAIAIETAGDCGATPLDQLEAMLVVVKVTAAAAYRLGLRHNIRPLSPIVRLRYQVAETQRLIRGLAA